MFDLDLIRYCRENNFPTHFMTYEDYKTVENSFGFKMYKLKLSFRRLINNIRRK